MEEKYEIINRVALSSLVTLDLNEYYPKGERVLFDLKNCLYQELILKERDFRQFVKSTDWNLYKDKNVAIDCSVDAIVPVWAYMLVASSLAPYARHVVFGNLSVLESFLWKESLSAINPDEYLDAKMVIKGCGKRPVPEFAFVEATRILQPIVSSIMYGEPCSTVPIYKKR